MAEGDRDAYRRQEAALEREREIMKDVKGWEVSLMTKHDCNILMKGYASSGISYPITETQPGKSVYNNARYRSAESIVVL